MRGFPGWQFYLFLKTMANKRRMTVKAHKGMPRGTRRNPRKKVTAARRTNMIVRQPTGDVLLH